MEHRKIEFALLRVQNNIRICLQLVLINNSLETNKIIAEKYNYTIQKKVQSASKVFI